MECVSILRDGIIGKRMFRVIHIEDHEHNTIRLQMKLHLTHKWVTIREWDLFLSGYEDEIDFNDLEFVKNEAIELFNIIVYPYKNIE